MTAIHGMLPKLYEFSHDGRMTSEGLQGEYADQGVVMMQLNQLLKDAEKPKWHLQIDPFTRYEPLAKLAADKYKGAKAMENKHPVVQRFYALLMRSGSDGISGLCTKSLVSVGGKAISPTFPTKVTECGNPQIDKGQECTSTAQS